MVDFMADRVLPIIVAYP